MAISISPSRNNEAVTINRSRLADGKLRREIVVLTDILEQLLPRTPAKKNAAGPRCGIGAGIVDGEFVFQRIEIRSRESLHEMQPVGGRSSLPVDPELFVEADGIDDQ